MRALVRRQQSLLCLMKALELFATSTALDLSPSPHTSGRRLLDSRVDSCHKCLCIFDFDNTLRITRDGNGWTTAPDAYGVLQKCMEKNYGVAIASANDDDQFISWFLSTRVDGQVFSSDFFKSAAFQTGQRYKTTALKTILGYFGTPAHCAMFFDDAWYNRQYADETGVIFQQVDPHAGVSWNDYKVASSTLRNQCSCY